MATELEIVEKNIADMQDLVNTRQDALSRAGDRLNAYRLEKIKLVFGIEVGSVVREKRGKIYQVTGISNLDWRKPWLEGRFFKKDGTLSKNSQSIYEWELATKSDMPAEENGDTSE